MSRIEPQRNRRLSEAARAAALAARRAKMDEPDDFGVPRLFVVRKGARAFAWELRRFGGVLLQRGEVSFVTFDEAMAAGNKALVSLCAMADQRLKRQNVRENERCRLRQEPY